MGWGARSYLDCTLDIGKSVWGEKWKNNKGKGRGKIGEL